MNGQLPLPHKVSNIIINISMTAVSLHHLLELKTMLFPSEESHKWLPTASSKTHHCCDYQCCWCTVTYPSLLWLSMLLVYSDLPVIVVTISAAGVQWLTHHCCDYQCCWCTVTYPSLLWLSMLLVYSDLPVIVVTINAAGVQWLTRHCCDCQCRWCTVTYPSLLWLSMLLVDSDLLELKGVLCCCSIPADGWLLFL